MYPKEAISKKLIDLTAKENAIEDCLVTMKKAYEKDALGLQDFLAVSYLLDLLMNGNM